MTNLYLVLVGDNWRDEFDETASSKVKVGDDAPDFLSGLSEERFWGAASGKGETKRKHFEEMEPDDAILFHDGEVVFATGHPGQKYGPDGNGATMGEWLWDNAASDLVFTVEDYEDDFRVELDQVWRVLGFKSKYNQMYSYKKVSDDAIEKLLEDFESIEDFQQAIVNREFGAYNIEDYSDSDFEAVSPNAPYYWVNQSEPEIDGEYLRAPVEEKFQYDLPKLERGDIVFSYCNGEIRGFHEVVEPASIKEISTDEAVNLESEKDTVDRYIVETEFTPFEEPLDFADVFPRLWNEDVRLDKYYPVNQGGINQQYFYNLSQAAGDYLMQEGMGSQTEYEGITEAEEDILDRLDHIETVRNLLAIDLAEDTVRKWTKALRRNDLVDGEVSNRDVEVLQHIREIYESHKEVLSETASDLGVGTLNDCSAGEMLYIVLVRELQRQAGYSDNQINLNQVKLPIILEESYDVVAPISSPETQPREATKIQDQIEDKQQLVFHGPPGTGKTYTANQFAKWWLEKATAGDPSKDQLETVTFHPSFTYEDFIEGLTAKEQNGVVEYRVEPGVFRELVERARHAFENAENPEDAAPYLLIIDEINRGNLAKIFGEVITLLESDKRLGAENETTIRLPHSGETFGIPPNLYVIGTMNTADRSIALVDAALRRRFRFLHFPPDTGLLFDHHDFANRRVVEAAAETPSEPGRSLLGLSILAIEELNSRIRRSPDLGRGKQIGHSTLMGIDQEMNPEALADEIVERWRYEIMPLLEEYYFGQFNRISEELFDDGGEQLFDTEDQEIQDFDTTELATALSGLLDGIEADYDLLRIELGQ